MNNFGNRDDREKERQENCEHDFIDVSTFGAVPYQLCILCGKREYQQEERGYN